MIPKNYWQNKHQKYSATNWIDNPTIFAQQVIKFFPKNGKLIDLGAGQGQDSQFFAKNNFQIISTDFCQDALDICQKMSSNLKINFQNVDFSYVV